MKMFPFISRRECQSDSPIRTTAKVKEAINKHIGRLSSTSHLFERTGVIRLNVKGSATFDNVWEVAVENGAEDVRHWESDDEGALGVEVSFDPHFIISRRTLSLCLYTLITDNL